MVYTELKSQSQLSQHAMKPYQPISCDLHDHLEIACLYAYPLKIELRDKRVITAVAKTTLTEASKIEYLLVECGNQEHKIRLDEILAITVTDVNAKIGRITF